MNILLCFYTNVRMKNEKKKKKGMFPMCPIKVEI